MNPKTKNIIAWIVTVLIIPLLASGVAKMVDFENPETSLTMSAQFAAYGYPIWFMYFIGVAEIAGVIGLFIPKLRILAASGLLVIMVGAFVTHLIAGDGDIGGSLTFTVLLVAFILLRKGSRLATSS
ncbi:MAG: DoxX family protein [Salibacteraceae bacterium]|mgnify:FL=1